MISLQFETTSRLEAVFGFTKSFSWPTDLLSGPLRDFDSCDSATANLSAGAAKAGLLEPDSLTRRTAAERVTVVATRVGRFYVVEPLSSRGHELARVAADFNTFDSIPLLPVHRADDCRATAAYSKPNNQDPVNCPTGDASHPSPPHLWIYHVLGVCSPI